MMSLSSSPRYLFITRSTIVNTCESRFNPNLSIPNRTMFDLRKIYVVNLKNGSRKKNVSCRWICNFKVEAFRKSRFHCTTLLDGDHGWACVQIYHLLSLSTPTLSFFCIDVVVCKGNWGFVAIGVFWKEKGSNLNNTLESLRHIYLQHFRQLPVQIERHL